MQEGTITGLKAHCASGIAILVIEDGQGTRHHVYADNAPLMRAIDMQVPGFIGEGHTVNPSLLVGRRCMYDTDDLGLLDTIHIGDT